jgi:hypothetical protein
MSEYVKEALEAGRKGICLTLDIEPSQVCEKPCQLCREGASAAIAAFLEALPPRLMLPISQTHVAGIGNQGRLALIAAVREVKP